MSALALTNKFNKLNWWRSDLFLEPDALSVQLWDMQAGQQFKATYDEHFTDIYRYLVWSIGKTDLAEDIAQSVFESLWKFAGKHGQFPDNSKAWLMRVASNQVKDHYSQKRQNRNLSTKLQESSPGKLEKSGESQFTMAEMEVELRAMIASLGEPQSTILYAIDVEKKNYNVVVAEIGLSERTIRNLRKRAWETIEKQLLKLSFPAEIINNLPVKTKG